MNSPKQSGYTPMLWMFGLPDAPGNCSRVFQAVASGGIVVDMIIQNMTAGHPELSFSVPQPDLARALDLTRTVARSIAAIVREFSRPGPAAGTDRRAASSRGGRA